jgi:hypothetical protein
LFNSRDWEAVRAMLVDDVKLELVSRLKRSGRSEVSSYFGNYDSTAGWCLVPAWLEDREVLAVLLDPADPNRPYFIELKITGERVAGIRDFRYVPYILQEAALQLAE